MAGRFRSQNLKSKEEETSLLSEATPKVEKWLVGFVLKI